MTRAGLLPVESQVRRALWRLLFYRLLGDLFILPRLLFAALASATGAIEKTFFYLELDAARRYRALTNIDLGIAVGEQARYAGLTRAAAEDRDVRWEAAREDSE